MYVLLGPGCVEASQNEQVGQTADEDGYEVALRAHVGWWGMMVRGMGAARPHRDRREV
tara:strand:+ start:36047 stop:36220 length:174 start_codon:yes stop_codon:yes gene_type:complete